MSEHQRGLRAEGRRTERGGVPALAAVAMVGVSVGLFAFTFSYGEGTAYLSNDPAACANCHVMAEPYESWRRSSHRNVAVCNDCHLPPGFLGKWLTKADNGLLHSWAFTTNDFHEPIRIKPRNARRTQQACLACHGPLVHALEPAEAGGDMLACAHCHADVGHALR